MHVYVYAYVNVLVYVYINIYIANLQESTFNFCAHDIKSDYMCRKSCVPTPIDFWSCAVISLLLIPMEFSSGFPNLFV